EVAQVARLRGLVVRFELLLARPCLHGLADGVADIRCEQARADGQHLVPASGAMEPERRAVVRLRERVLELVPVAVLRARRHDRLERRVGDAAESRERVPYLCRLRLELALVCVVLE